MSEISFGRVRHCSLLPLSLSRRFVEFCENRITLEQRVPSRFGQCIQICDSWAMYISVKAHYSIVLMFLIVRHSPKD